MAQYQVVRNFLLSGLFGISFLAALIVSRVIWQADWWITRYDALFVYAVAMQGLLIWSGLETWREARVILLFHLTGTVMEWFKVAEGSWAYPGPAVLAVWDVPLFSGFMYASVGSFIAGAMRRFELRFDPYPALWLTWGLAAGIYLNFFAHHFGPDWRYVLIGATVVIFWRTKVNGWPMVLVFLAGACALYGAETIGTWSRTWVYAGQAPFQPVSFGKFTSWYLLLYVAFVTVTLVTRRALVPGPAPLWSKPRETV